VEGFRPEVELTTFASRSVKLFFFCRRHNSIVDLFPEIIWSIMHSPLAA